MNLSEKITLQTAIDFARYCLILDLDPDHMEVHWDHYIVNRGLHINYNPPKINYNKVSNEPFNEFDSIFDWEDELDDDIDMDLDLDNEN